MKDKKTGLTYKTKYAVEQFLTNNIVGNNPNYSFEDALQEAGYTYRYARSFGSKIWQNMAVQSLVTKAKANLAVKTAVNSDLSVQTVLKDLKMAKDALLDEDSKVSRRFITAYLKILEMEGDYLAMWTKNLNVTDTQRERELDEADQAELAELAKLRLKAKYNLHEKAPSKPVETRTLAEGSQIAPREISTAITPYNAEFAKNNKPLS